MRTFDQHPWVQRIKQESAERQAWAEANPELARDWGEAIALDDELNAQREMVRQQERDRAETPKRLEEMGCPFRAVSMLAKGVDTVAIGAVKAFMADPAPAFLLMHGPPGRGKTVAACAFLGACHVPPLGYPRRVGQFWTSAALAVLPAFGEENERRWEELSHVPNLVIDDLGVEAPTEWWRGRLDALIDLRYSGRGLRTVITTNLGVDQFKKSPKDGGYGERIARRIRESGHVKGIA